MFIITENSQSALASFLTNNGIEPYRASQIFHWIYKRGKLSFSDFINLPKQSLGILEAKCAILTGKIITCTASKSDKTKKFLIKLTDNNLIESALLHSEDNRITACLSTQVGCSVCCVFCASGKAGFKRNLTVSEIVSQYLLMRQESLRHKDDITNIVFMGIGEPMLNFDNLMSAIDLLTESSAANIGARHITVSTSGIAPMIARLADYKKQIRLSVSLHSAFNTKRDKLVPLNKKYSIDTLIKAVKVYIARTSKPVTFEYVLIKGLNDTKDDIAELVRVLKDIKCKVNIIPYNRIAGLDYRAPSDAEVDMFVDGLIKSRIKVVRRKRRGFDINSGCGQLKARFSMSF